MLADAANMPTEFAGGLAALYGDGTWRIQILLESKVNRDFAPFFQVNGFKAAGGINPVGIMVLVLSILGSFSAAEKLALPVRTGMSCFRAGPCSSAVQGLTVAVQVSMMGTKTE